MKLHLEQYHLVFLAKNVSWYLLCRFVVSDDKKSIQRKKFSNAVQNVFSLRRGKISKKLDEKQTKANVVVEVGKTFFCPFGKSGQRVMIYNGGNVGSDDWAPFAMSCVVDSGTCEEKWKKFQCGFAVE